jgi:large subunit ribosomal protein L25
MAETTLNAEKRTSSGKGVARKLRAQGRVPAVVYGANEETLA